MMRMQVQLLVGHWVMLTMYGMHCSPLVGRVPSSELSPTDSHRRLWKDVLQLAGSGPFIVVASNIRVWRAGQPSGDDQAEPTST